MIGFVAQATKSVIEFDRVPGAGPGRVGNGLAEQEQVRRDVRREAAIASSNAGHSSARPPL